MDGNKIKFGACSDKKRARYACEIIIDGFCVNQNVV